MVRAPAAGLRSLGKDWAWIPQVFQRGHRQSLPLGHREAQSGKGLAHSHTGSRGQPGVPSLGRAPPHEKLSFQCQWALVLKV